ncbi:MAG: ATP-binding protein [Flavobacteriia bacterium]|nr:ATP-binding protein [Flavobacteriia bacterium]
MREGFTLIRTLKLPSNVESISSVENLIDEISIELALNEDLYGNVLISVTEAVNNAIQHGNKYQNELMVTVLVFDGSDAFCFSVSDEGDGFDFLNLPDPTAPQNILNEHGRGVYLMQNLADEVVFEDGGKTVLLYFKK